MPRRKQDQTMTAPPPKKLNREQLKLEKEMEAMRLEEARRQATIAQTARLKSLRLSRQKSDADKA
jgi:hypothetical protein